MKAALRRIWESRLPWQRVGIAVLASVLGIGLYAWLVGAAGPARTQLRTSVAALRAQATLLDQQSIEIGRLRAAPPATTSTTDLRTLAQGRIGAAGLSRALLRIDAPDADQVVVAFGALAYADWLGWVADLQSHQVRLDACRIEALAAPGMVSVTATLARPKQK